MKTNKSFIKRLKITKNGKVLARKPGFSHFNAKQSRVQQLQGKSLKAFPVTPKNKSQFIPFT